jgi:hypothetical protein
LSMASSSPIAPNLREILLDRLPVDVERALSSAVDQSLVTFGIVANDAAHHLDLRALQTNNGSNVSLKAVKAVVAFVVLLPLTKEAKVFATIDLCDQFADGTLAEGARQVSLEANSLLIYPAAVATGAIRLMDGDAVILEGALYDGEAVATA